MHRIAILFLTLTWFLSAAGCASGSGASAPTPTPAPRFPPDIAIEPLVDAQTLITSLTHSGDGSGRLFLTTRSGQILIIQNGRLKSQPFLDLTALVDSKSIEQGLLGLAFDPEYALTGEFYVYYTSIEPDNDTFVGRYRVSDDPDRADPGSVEPLLIVDQPANNHNGGHLVFGPDGTLYIGLGDGGPGNDPRKFAQNPMSLLGKILRLAVRGEDPYAIPPDNPYAGSEVVRQEIWASGMRNPWSFSFDRATGDFYMGDVGQEKYEELNFLPAPLAGGANFGWNVLEGLHCFSPAEGCSTDGLTPPIYTYEHGDAGCSIIGGSVYRGSAYPELIGTYFFGDFCTGVIRGAQRDPRGVWEIVDLLDTDLAIAAFGEDEVGELYVLDLQGKVFRITAAFVDPDQPPEGD